VSADGDHWEDSYNGVHYSCYLDDTFAGEACFASDGTVGTVAEPIAVPFTAFFLGVESSMSES
jgi:hypothetical protein